MNVNDSPTCSSYLSLTLEQIYQLKSINTQIENNVNNCVTVIRSSFNDQIIPIDIIKSFPNIKSVEPLIVISTLDDINILLSLKNLIKYRLVLRCNYNDLFRLLDYYINNLNRNLAPLDIIIYYDHEMLIIILNGIIYVKDDKLCELISEYGYQCHYLDEISRVFMSFHTRKNLKSLPTSFINNRSNHYRISLPIKSENKIPSIIILNKRNLLPSIPTI